GIRKLLFHVYRGNPSAEVLGTAKRLAALGFDASARLEEDLCLARPRITGARWNEAFWVSGLSAC
ncbi:MAG: hypothetical protein EBX52_10200, partial [Proteobacteria bacterium]|nr:hypothetical protein [Pseudomonadota bacterium]